MKMRLLLHTCCAPCLSQCLNVLSGLDSWQKALQNKPDFEIGIYYDNPNIYPAGEFTKRKSEVEKLITLIKTDLFPILMPPDSSEEMRKEWQKSADPYRDEPEKGKRCAFCYEFRLSETFRKAQELNYDCVATTLTLSPFKDTEKINDIGAKLSKNFGPDYIESDFKKNNGFKKSIELCRKYQIYSQNYCGCIYSIQKQENP